MQPPTITYDGIFGPAWGSDGAAAGGARLVSEFGSGTPNPAAIAAAAAGPGMIPFVGRDFFRSSDFGLIVLGALVLYLDLRIINRKRS
jgi:hypothetical protein